MINAELFTFTEVQKEKDISTVLPYLPLFAGRGFYLCVKSVKTIIFHLCYVPPISSVAIHI